MENISISQNQLLKFKAKLRLLRKGTPKPKNKFPKFRKMKVLRVTSLCLGIILGRSIVSFIQGSIKVKINEENYIYFVH